MASLRAISVKMQPLIRLCAAALSWWFASDAIAVIKEEAIRSAASALAGVAATMVGFMLAALSVLTAVANQRLIRNMQKTGHYRRLLHELYHCGGAYAIMLVGAMVSLFAPSPAHILSLTVGVSAYALLVMLSAGKKFWMVLTHLNG